MSGSTKCSHISQSVINRWFCATAAIMDIFIGRNTAKWRQRMCVDLMTICVLPIFRSTMEDFRVVE